MYTWAPHVFPDTDKITLSNLGFRAFLPKLDVSEPKAQRLNDVDQHTQGGDAWADLQVALESTRTLSSSLSLSPTPTLSLNLSLSLSPSPSLRLSLSLSLGPVTESIPSPTLQVAHEQLEGLLQAQRRAHRNPAPGAHELC